MKIQLFFDDSLQPFSSRISYVLAYLEQHPHCPKGVTLEEGKAQKREAIYINYGGGTPPSPHYTIPAQQLIFIEEVSDSKTWCANAYPYEGLTLFSVEKGKKAASKFLENRTFGFDILEMLFFHLTRFEEYHCDPVDWDEWEMMRSDLQFLPRQYLHHQAVVDQLVYCFFHALGLKPERSKTTLGVSHDIDVFRKYSSWYRFGRTSARMWRNGRSWTEQQHSFKTFQAVRTGRGQDPYDTFDWLLLDQALSHKHIYFLSGGITRYDRFYQIEASYVPATIQLAIDRGYTIGLHPSYAAHTDQDLLLEEKHRLEQIAGISIQDSRQHFLHFDQQQTLALLESSGMKTDATFGYQDRIGFRCGTGFPYRLYNLNEERISTITEIPMVVMDTALLMLIEENMQDFQKHLTDFLQKNQQLTHLTFNFHNSTFDPLRLNDQQLKLIYLELFQTHGAL